MRRLPTCPPWLTRQSQCKKKADMENTQRCPTTSAYSLTSLPAQPSCFLSSLPYEVESNYTSTLHAPRLLMMHTINDSGNTRAFPSSSEMKCRPAPTPRHIPWRSACPDGQVSGQFTPYPASLILPAAAGCSIGAMLTTHLLRGSQVSETAPAAGNSKATLFFPGML